jgi:TonB family protein
MHFPMNAASMLRLFCVIWCGVAACGAQAPADVYRIGGGVSPPRLHYKVEPKYSDEARAARLAGKVMMKVVIGTDGKAHDIQVLHSLGLGLDEKAIEAVSQWQFEPGTKGGEPVRVFAQIEVNFRLLDNPQGVPWHLGRVEFHLPPEVSRPVIKKGPSPHVAGDSSSATATLTFNINETGTPDNIQIEKTSDEDWASSVTAVLREWKFTPASKDGSPVSVPCTMDFVRGDETTQAR